MSRGLKVEVYPVRGVDGEACQARNTKTREAQRQKGMACPEDTE